MVILAFEASGSALSAAVLSDDDAVSSVWEEARFGQAARLVPLAVSALAKAGKSFADITHVAAGCGPGSFTGIRVALAAAKGVCLAQDVPGLGISGLQALA
ncbi:MAG: tRNA (adenosine(37)-N6)-threonylcarbamoyltransferase complex dimerization subunit type 1 TsaB, partial [Candidatus Puniceispirillum sp.]